jgi:hypothetical protein
MAEATVPSAVNVKVAVIGALLERFTDAGEIAHNTPKNCVSQVIATVLFMALAGAIVRVVLDFCPTLSVTELGFGDTVKSGTFTKGSSNPKAEL